MKKWPIIVVLIFLLLALATSFMKRSGGDMCALDATKIEPIYQVDITPAEEKTLKFCCIECAKKWQAANKGKAGSVTVTDEVTGKRIDASIAWFVESNIVTNQSTGNRIHAFAEKADAEKHSKDFRGTIIRNPFSVSIAQDKCSLCGMGVDEANRQYFMIITKDGKRQKVCNQGCAVILMENIDAGFVEAVDYNTGKNLNAGDAFYVKGSSVKPVMGGESVVAFLKREDAEMFRKENGGRILTYDDIFGAGGHKH